MENTKNYSQTKTRHFLGLVALFFMSESAKIRTYVKR